MGADKYINIRHQALQDYLSNNSSGTKQSSTEDQTSGLHNTY